MGQEKNKGGRPRIYGSQEEFMQAIRNYMDHCIANDLIATDYGFIRFSGISHDTYYNYINRFSDDLKKTIDAMQIDIAINSKRPPAMAIFTLKNTQGWQDTPQVVIDNRSISIDSNSDEIDKLLSKLGYLPIPGDS